MSAPPKPWETQNFQRGDFSTFSNNMAAAPIADRLQSAALGTPVPASNPPQLPPRPAEQSSSLNSRLGYGTGLYGAGSYAGGYSGLGMGYGGYSSPYGGLYSTPYNSYGGYGGYNRLGAETNSAFARHAEESSRPAFESINSIVQAVNSVGMMLDSTFQAVYNSFRAVIGVADNFSRLKMQLVQVFSALAFIRTIRYFLRRVLELLRLRPQGEAHQLWTEAVREAAASSDILAAAGGASGGRSSWPILMFFGIIMGGPYLIWKLISAFAGSQQDETAWARGEVDHYVAVANFPFKAVGAEELSFSEGQTLTVAPKELQPRVRGWLLASVDGHTTGMIPANYVKIQGKRKGSKTPGTSTNTQTTVPPTATPQPPATSLPQTPLQVGAAQLESAFSAVPTAPTQVPSAWSSLTTQQHGGDSSSSGAGLTDSLGSKDAADILNDS